jgi:hypothetical protein
MPASGVVTSSDTGMVALAAVERQREEVRK